MGENKEHLLLALLGIVLFGLVSAVSLLMLYNYTPSEKQTSDSWLKSFNIYQSDWLKAK